MERGTTGSSDLKPAAAIPAMLEAGEGVTLHPVTLGDAAELYAAIERNRSRLQPWLPWATPGYGPEEARAFIALCERENADGRALALVIRKHGALCGSVAFHRIDLRNQSTSLGYWLDGEHEGSGIMTRACRAVVTEGFRSYNLHRIEIRCGTGNERSAAIPRRLGFTEEGILREAEWVRDRWVDLRVFGMLRRDWESK